MGILGAQCGSPSRGMSENKRSLGDGLQCIGDPFFVAGNMNTFRLIHASSVNRSLSEADQRCRELFFSVIRAVCLVLVLERNM